MALMVNGVGHGMQSAKSLRGAAGAKLHLCDERTHVARKRFRIRSSRSRGPRRSAAAFSSPARPVSPRGGTGGRILEGAAPAGGSSSGRTALMLPQPGVVAARLRQCLAHQDRTLKAQRLRGAVVAVRDRAEHQCAPRSGPPQQILTLLNPLNYRCERRSVLLRALQPLDGRTGRSPRGHHVGTKRRQLVHRPLLDSAAHFNDPVKPSFNSCTATAAAPRSCLTPPHLAVAGVVGW